MCTAISVYDDGERVGSFVPRPADRIGQFGTPAYCVARYREGSWEELFRLPNGGYARVTSVLSAATGGVKRYGLAEAMSEAGVAEYLEQYTELFPGEVWDDPPSSATGTGGPPADLAPAERPTITISAGESRYSVRRDSGQPKAVPGKYHKLFAKLAGKVLTGSPDEVVPWTEVNESHDPTATEPLGASASRSAVYRFRRWLVDALDTPPGGGHWVETEVGSGLRLTPRANWVVAAELRKGTGGGNKNGRPVDPTILADTVTETGARAGSSRGRRRNVSDDE